VSHLLALYLALLSLLLVLLPAPACGLPRRHGAVATPATVGSAARLRFSASVLTREVGL
jgi:hypothetical protein